MGALTPDYHLRGWQRARRSITSSPSRAPTVLDDLGRFISTKHWYDDPADPFKRGPSFLTFDRERNAVVLQDQRVWMAGLSDEGGAGAWLALIMKQLGAPNAAEIEKFERFVTQTLDGRLQVNQGPDKFGVRKSLFYYEPQAPQGVRYDPAIELDDVVVVEEVTGGLRRALVQLRARRRRALGVVSTGALSRWAGEGA